MFICYIVVFQKIKKTKIMILSTLLTTLKTFTKKQKKMLLKPFIEHTGGTVLTKLINFGL